MSVLACGIAGSIAFVSAAPALGAVAKHPKSGSYSQSTKKAFQMEFTLDKGKVSNAIHYDDCVVTPITLPKIKVTKGRFSYDGTRTNVSSQKYKIHLDGRFVSRTMAKGTWTAERLGKDPCTSDFDYKAVRTGPAQG
jgi:hypothetical protein